MTGVRIDKWLWAARFFKTRSLAAKACELGRVRSNGVPAKAAREVRTGDLLQIRNDGGDFHVACAATGEVVAEHCPEEADGSSGEALANADATEEIGANDFCWLE